MLDNCEHLVETLAPFVDRVRSACPDVTVLATSREPLGLSGERTWPVRPLALPESDAESVQAIAGAEAVQLFVDRAAAANPGFVLTEENAAADRGDLSPARRPAARVRARRGADAHVGPHRARGTACADA